MWLLILQQASLGRVRVRRQWKSLRLFQGSNCIKFTPDLLTKRASYKVKPIVSLESSRIQGEMKDWDHQIDLPLAVT